MPKKILAIDDEWHIVHLIQTHMERAGYEVIAAFDGTEAMEKVELESPDLILLDVTLPDMDWFEMFQNLRQNPVTRELPIIVMQVRRADADVLRDWQSDIDDYIMKPFNPDQLNSVVERLLT